MEASNEHPFLSPRRHFTYTRYSIACFIVWGVLLAICAATAKTDTFHTVLTVFGGWVIGWTSASIARVVYPPPKRSRTA